MVNSHFIGSFAKLPSNASSCSSKHSRFIETFHWNKWIPVNLHHIYTRKPWQVKRSLGEGGDLFFSPKVNMAMRSSSIYNVYINKYVFVDICYVHFYTYIHETVYIYICDDSPLESAGCFLMVLNLEGVFCMEKSAPFCLTGLTIMEVVGHPYTMVRGRGKVSHLLGIGNSWTQKYLKGRRYVRCKKWFGEKDS